MVGNTIYVCIQRNPSEWFKKEDCWNALLERLPTFSEPLPAELSYADAGAPGTERATPAVSVDDYDRIARCMAVSSARWLEAAERGQRAGVIHWKVAGICRTMAEYAAGGWERKPSAKQARPALEALAVVKEAGLLSGAESASA